MLNRYLTVNGQPLSRDLKSALWNLALEFKILMAHRRGLRQARPYRGAHDLKLNVGCGPRHKHGWLNVDLWRNADVTLDLRKPLPFDDDSCSIIYSEHFFEHLDYPEPAGAFLRESCRVLRPGGTFSVVVPDIEFVLRSFVLGGDDAYYAAQQRWHPRWCETQMEHVNYNFRQNNEHRFCYDFETLQRLMQRNGFEQIRRREYDPALDSEERIVGSMYVEALKPDPSRPARVEKSVSVTRDH